MITAAEVKKLRDATGAGMMDCKKALTEADGDFEAAVENLRKKGQKVMASRADRDAKEGVIAAAVSEDGSQAVMVEVNSETDFVARNEEFIEFANDVTNTILASMPGSRDEMLGLTLGSGSSIADAVETMVGKIGEKIDVRRFEAIKVDDGKVIPYIHPGSKLGVLVKMAGSGDTDATGRDVAMQVAAMNPVSTSRDEVPTETQEKEMEIAREVARNEGKPEQIIDKIATGKLERYFKDNVLLEQPFVKDSSMNVGEMLKQNETSVSGFIRFALGG